MPYEGASHRYREKFIATMRAMGNENPNVPTNMLDAQALWDATMADSLAKALEENPQQARSVLNCQINL